MCSSDLGAFIGEEAKILRGAQRGAAHKTQRLSGIQAFNQRNLFPTRFDRIGDPMENRAPLVTCFRTPRRKGRLRRRGGGIYILLIAGDHLVDDTAIHGGHVVKNFPACATDSFTGDAPSGTSKTTASP